jgi:hypothetical protein
VIPRSFTHPPKKYKPVQYDRQQHKVYHMEKYWIGGSVKAHMEVKTMREVVRHACRKYNCAPPKLRIIKSSAELYGFCTGEAIILNRTWSGDNISTLLHELAHWILDKTNACEEVEDHGPEFMRIYCELLDRYKVMPRDCMDLLCKQHGIEVEI